jgi:putative transcriptional regulator
MSTPGMGDPRFERTVIYMCTHNKEGAMGLVINRPVTHLDFPQLLEQLKIEVTAPVEKVVIHAGGPVESGRGFVLHSADFVQNSTMVISETIALTATVDILRAMATGRGPQHQLLALGYAGWGAGQLDIELNSNGWLSTDADDELIFNTGLDDKWPCAMTMLGVDISMLSAEAGHA